MSRLRAVLRAIFVETARALQPDVIVKDLSMPALDGWAATEALKRNPRTQGIPVIALSGYMLLDVPDARAHLATAHEPRGGCAVVVVGAIVAHAGERHEYRHVIPPRDRLPRR